MKKLLIIIIGLLLAICFSGCSNYDIQDYYGKYTFKEVSYLWPASSSRPESINQSMAGAKYTIEADLFKIESANNTFEIHSPKYVKEEIPNKSSSSALSDVRSFIGDDVKYQYAIYNEEGYRVEWRLYVSSDCLWIAQFDNSKRFKEGTGPIRFIYKLSK